MLSWGCVGWGSVLLGALGGLGAFSLATSAWAQVSPAPTTPGPLVIPVVGDIGADRDALSGYRVSSPLRLSLEASIRPLASLFPQCATLEDDVGNSVGGIPVQYYREVRLVPRLVLSLFTQLGCPIDAGIGAALTYTIPILDSFAFVLGAGVYGAPAQTQLYGGLGRALAQGAQGEASSVHGALRGDVVWKTSAGRPLSLGVESLGAGTQGVRFGGGF